MFLLHNKNSELMAVRSFDVTHVSHYVKAEPLDRTFFFFKKNFKFVSAKKN
jgi:hypothetical protein